MNIRCRSALLVVFFMTAALATVSIAQSAVSINHPSAAAHQQDRTGAHHQQEMTGIRLPETPLSVSGSDLEMMRTPTVQRIPAFRIPRLKGMNLYPGYVIVDRYALPPPPWLHFHIQCAIYRGNVYVEGSFTGNFGRPISGETAYIGRGRSALGSFTSSDSGHFSGVVALPASPIATPAGMVRSPMQCTVPRVKVGTPSRAKVDQGTSDLRPKGPATDK